MEFRAHHLIGRMFGVREKRLVAKGKARQRFQELIDQRLEADRHADRLWQRVDFGRVCRDAIFHNHVVPAGGTHPKWIPSVGLEVVGQTDIGLPATVDPVAQETPMPGDMAPVDPVGTVPTSTPSNAEPETLRSPATGMNDASETPSPPPAGSTPTGRRKKRPPTMEMEDPPLS